MFRNWRVVSVAVPANLAYRTVIVCEMPMKASYDEGCTICPVTIYH